jgi:hypothetical protein
MDIASIEVDMKPADSPSPDFGRPLALTWRGLPDFERIVERSRRQRGAACAALLSRILRGVGRGAGRGARHLPSRKRSETALALR